MRAGDSGVAIEFFDRAFRGCHLLLAKRLERATNSPSNQPAINPSVTGEQNMPQLATFGAGCFWGVEATFRQLPGVLDAAVGYAGGQVENPTYEQVCTDTTGHAEVVQLQFDPEHISYEELVEAFFRLHDPTTKNRQGPDVGRQYRSVIFTHDLAQEAVAREVTQRVAASGRFARPVVTQIAPATTFFRAEEYHQQYLAKHGRGSCHL